MIILFIICIAWALFTALYYLLKPGSANGKMAKALTFRIGLSLVLFVILVSGAYLGIFPMHRM
jgi:hypothetical protein